MKNYIALLFVALLLSCSNTEKNGRIIFDSIIKTDTINADQIQNPSIGCDTLKAAGIIKTIDIKIKSIQPSKKDILDKSSEGGEGLLYYQEGQLIKIKCILYGETGKVNYGMYFWDKNIFYVEKKTFSYRLPVTSENPHIERTSRDAIFFEHGKICAVKKNDSLVVRDTQENNLLQLEIESIITSVK